MRGVPSVVGPAPFLKWAGGKRAVLPHLLAALSPRFRRYHEPFVGGGALFFALAARRPPPRPGEPPWAVLGDANERLVRAYRGVRDRVDEVIRHLRGHAERHGRAHYYAVRDADPEAMDDAEAAAWLIYLNRTGFNGLYRVNRRGRFNVPMGRYRNPRIVREPELRAASAALAGAELHVADFREVAERAEPGDLVYFDPPYVPLSETAYFTSYTEAGFGPDDQRDLARLARALLERGVHVVLSNHDTPEVRALYAGPAFRLQAVPVRRSINSRADRRGPVGELVIVGRP